MSSDQLSVSPIAIFGTVAPQIREINFMPSSSIPWIKKLSTTPLGKVRSFFQISMQRNIAVSVTWRIVLSGLVGAHSAVQAYCTTIKARCDICVLGRCIGCFKNASSASPDLGKLVLLATLELIFLLVGSLIEAFVIGNIVLRKGRMLWLFSTMKC